PPAPRLSAAGRGTTNARRSGRHSGIHYSARSMPCQVRGGPPGGRRRRRHVRERDCEGPVIDEAGGTMTPAPAAIDGPMPSAPTNRLSVVRVAWCQLVSQWDTSVGAALALLLALLPAGLVLADRSGARSDLHTVIAAAGSLTVQRAGVVDPQTFDA